MPLEQVCLNLLISIRAAFQNHGDLVVGNIIGSNISNICLVFGFVLLFFNFRITNKVNAKLSYIYLCIVSVIFYYFIYTSELNLVRGLILLICLGLYVYLIIKYFSNNAIRKSDIQDSLAKLLLFIILGAILLSFGSSLFLDGAIGIAIKIGVNNSIIGLTLVALGTSIPELFVSVNAAIKKEYDFVIGNVIGSNIINIVLVGGISGLLNLLVFNKSDFEIFNTLSLILSFLLIFVFIKKTLINRFLGAIFIIIYLNFLYINFS